ncbi:hypothetical protein GCM10010129_73020 [Streptomyces fumigatiscleroticus]|nr:hypothetical protein GCM10010129_73020 [Streptomyces fumigatiscleroticus]
MSEAGVVHRPSGNGVDVQPRVLLVVEVRPGPRPRRDWSLLEAPVDVDDMSEWVITPESDKAVARRRAELDAGTGTPPPHAPRTGNSCSRPAREAGVAAWDAVDAFRAARCPAAFQP